MIEKEVAVPPEREVETFHDSNLDEELAEEDTELSVEEREQEAVRF